MLATKIKFGLLAAACLAAGAPVIANLQREAAPKPKPRLARSYFEHNEQEYEREALRHWLMARLDAESVTSSDGLPTRMRIALAPSMSRADALANARAVAAFLNVHFRSEKIKSITEIDLQSGQANFAIMPYSSGPKPSAAISWRIMEGEAAR